MSFSARHTKYIEKFIAAQDWAGLLRYWKAHYDLRTALAAAHAVADDVARHEGEPHASVAAWLKRMVAQNTLLLPEISEELRQQLTSHEQITLRIMQELHALFSVAPDVAERARKGEIPLNDAGEALQSLLHAASQSIAEVGDPALENWLNETGCTMMFYLSLGDVGAADWLCGILESVVASWKAMAVERPLVYLTRAAYATGRLSVLQSFAGRFGESQSTAEDALAQWVTLEQLHPGNFQILLAEAWTNLAQMKTNALELESAKLDVLEALRILRAYVIANPSPESKQFLAGALTTLGETELMLGNPDASVVHYTESLALKREYIPLYEPHRNLLLISALEGLAMAERVRKNGRRARVHLLDARALGRQWQSANPGNYHVRLATTSVLFASLEVEEKNLEEAVRILNESIEPLEKRYEVRPDVFGQFLAPCLCQLGVAQRLMGQFAEARISLERAATVVTGGLGNVMGVKAYSELGWLLLDKVPALGWPDRSQAYRYFAQACRHSEAIRATFLDVKHRRRFQQEDSELFEGHIYNCVEWARDAPLAERAGVLREAIWAAEAGRSRLLLHRVMAAAWKPQCIPLELAEELQRCYRIEEMLRRNQGEPGQMSALVPGAIPQSRLDCSSDAGAIPALPSGDVPLRQWEARKAAIVAQCRLQYPEARLEPGVGVVDAVDIFPLIPREVPTAFVEFVIGASTAFAFILLPNESIRAVKLFSEPPPKGAESPKEPAPGLRAAKLAELADEWTKAGTAFRSALTPPPMQADARESEQEEVRAQEDAQARAFAATLAWEEAIAPVLRQIGALALDPVVDALPPEIVRVMISPHRALHMFPLHACPLREGLFGERCPGGIGYTPSFSLLHRIAQAGPVSLSRDQRAPILLLEDPTRDHTKDPLVFAACEIAAVHRRLYQSGQTDLHYAAGSKITQDSLVGDALHARAIHYSGHGAFEEGAPSLSRLRLSGAPATVDDIFAKLVLTNNELTCLNCCESGRMAPDDFDDFQNFTTAFLHAGARCVIATLWTVDDLPSALLMDAFYEKLLAGAPPTAALLAAQRHLRSLEIDASLDDAIDCLIPDQKGRADARELARIYSQRLGKRKRPFDSPSYWAAFTCNGAGFQPVSFASPR